MITMCLFMQVWKKDIALFKKSDKDTFNVKGFTLFDAILQNLFEKLEKPVGMIFFRFNIYVALITTMMIWDILFDDAVVDATPVVIIR